MKKSVKLFSDCSRVYVVDYWFDYRDAESLVVKCFKNAADAFRFLELLDSLGFQKFTFSVAYWKGYFVDNFNFILDED